MNGVSGGLGRVEPASSAPDWYSDLLGCMSRGHVSAGRRRAMAAATQHPVLTYWQVRRDNLQRQTSQGYGTRAITRPSIDLKRALPGATDFSTRNLGYMHGYAAAWADLENVQRSVAHCAGHIRSRLTISSGPQRKTSK